MQSSVLQRTHDRCTERRGPLWLARRYDPCHSFCVRCIRRTRFRADTPRTAGQMVVGTQSKIPHHAPGGDRNRRAASLARTALPADPMGERFATPGRSVWLYRDVRRTLAAQTIVLSSRTVGFHHHLYLFRAAGSTRLVSRPSQKKRYQRQRLSKKRRIVETPRGTCCIRNVCR